MAQDLIPPPSPAGRPEPESSASAGRIADNLWLGGEERRPRVSLGPPAGDGPGAAAPVLAEPPFRSRFSFAGGALIGVALAVVLLGTVLALDVSQKPLPNTWSAWQPSAGNRLRTAEQIAEHVALKYRRGDEDQLVAIRASGLEITERPLSVALKPAAVGSDIELIAGNGVMYTLNGLGKNGSIPSGKSSERRHLLLRREALELSLYTFRYAKDVDMVVTLLPPPPPKAGEEEAVATTLPPVPALFFRPGDLRGELGVPLDSTVPPLTPRPGEVDLAKPEAKRIDTLTRSNLFTATFQQGQDASLFLVLER